MIYHGSRHLKKRVISSSSSTKKREKKKRLGVALTLTEYNFRMAQMREILR